PTPIPVRVIKSILIIAIVVVMVFPFVEVIAKSFAAPDSTAGGLFPTSYSLAAYRSLLSGGIVSRAMLVSVCVTVVGTALSVFFTDVLAFGMNRTRSIPGGRVIFYLILITMLFNAGIIPNYLLLKNLGLHDSYWSLILPTLISAFN